MQRKPDIFNRFERQVPQGLSSDVIGCVLPRGSSGDNYVFSKASFEENSDDFILDDQGPAAIGLLTMDVNERQPSRTKRSSKKAEKASTKKYRKSTPKRREQCRLNQERYRKKQSEREKHLTVLVNELRDEVPILEIQHTRMRCCRDPTVWTVVAEYSHLFQHGTEDLQSPKARRQAAFLRSSMANDVIIGTRKGVDALLEQWRWYSIHFGDLQFQLKSATQSSQLVWASSVLEMTITDMTLAKVFPHLSYDGSAESLYSMMLGRRLVLPCRLYFEWNEDSKRVVRLETTVDFLVGLHKLLGSLENVNYVLERAHIA
ncbi:bZIP transcription factor 1 [Phytophthora citrophthora]|uniref:BZIP transcription factor 1 n=1 Tax=Phytophthora citrophthora TaxID=4793 RepID=A0AAD9GSD4_9STRA|nr:bZIP transcription factor 1 [Phytophthora citrophthora]